MQTEYYREIRREPKIVCYWRLNDLSGTSAIDRAGKYNLNGIYNGSPANGTSLIFATSGEINAFPPGSKLFGLNEQNLEIPDANPLNIEGDISIEAWVVSYEKEQISMILGKMNETGIPTFTFAEPYFLEVFKGAPVFALGNGTNQKFITSPNIIPVGTPTHIVATSFRKNMRIYINGEEVVNGKLESQEVKSSAKNILYIGAVGNNTKRFNGLIGEVALYNGAIPSLTVKNHFNIGRQILFKKPYYTTYDPPSYS